MNPPFNQVKVNRSFDFSSGRVSLAALFIDHFLNISSSGQPYVAILPDVIRSGTRYEKLRKKIEKDCRITKIEIKGKFSTGADIDVFILQGELSEKKGIKFFPASSKTDLNGETIDDIALVKVGSVVPHRDKEEGSIVDYYTARDIPKTGNTVHQRKVKSTTFSPPFVALRRTSSPSDKKRMVASIIRGEKPIALENHLIAIIPHDSKLQTCKRILSTLTSPKTAEFINQQIRCRHLTVSSIKSIPI